MYLLASSLILVIFSPVFTLQQADCTNGKVYLTCGSPCTLTCENYQSPPICSAVCSPGCFCPLGTVERNGQCIDPAECPTSFPPQVVTTLPQCSNGKVYLTCGSPCTLTCENYQSPPICLTVCSPGCFCPLGTVERNGQCIDTAECPTSSPPQVVTTLPQCSKGKIYSLCGSACPPSCDSSADTICTLQCVAGCFCPEGTVMHGDDCVAPELCPGEQTTTAPPPSPITTLPQCPNGKTYSMCGSACPLTCESPHSNFCTFQCTAGCFCPQGMVEYDDICLHPTSCPGATTPTPSDVCSNGKVYSDCGSPCPLTCDNPQNVCVFSCTASCYCPHGSVEYLDICISPEQCPVVPQTTSPPPTTSTTTQEVTTPPQCQNGKIYSSCGSPCPLSCDSPHSNNCTFECTAGCFCPHGMVEYDDICVHPTTCPGATTPPPSEYCTNGKIYSSCGSSCPLSCDSPHSNVCTFLCTEGCFCPHGLIEYGDTCVYPEQCPATPPSATTAASTSPPPTVTCPTGMEYRECGPVCKDTCGTLFGGEVNPCFSLRCAPGCFCPQGMIEHEGRCMDVNECPNADPCASVSCSDGWECEVDSQTLRPECKRPVYVPCTSDVPLACDSEFLRCIVQNKTRQADCLPTCFYDNGNCGDEETCVVSKTDYGSTLTCLSSNELPTDCPAGMHINQCGAWCQETCDDVLSRGLKACILVCGPPQCVCQQGLVRYRDRCVDSRECYSLDIYPPEVKPVPSVRSDMVLLKMSPRDVSLSQDDFKGVQTTFLNSLRQFLGDNEHGDVSVSLHAVRDGDDRLEVFIELSGGAVSSQTVNEFIALINSAPLSIPVDQVEEIDVPQLTNNNSVLSLEAIVGIAVGGGLGILILLILSVIVITCCCVNRRKPKNKTPVELDETVSPSDKVIYSQLVAEGIEPHEKKVEYDS